MSPCFLRYQISCSTKQTNLDPQLQFSTAADQHELKSIDQRRTPNKHHNYEMALPLVNVSCCVWVQKCCWSKWLAVLRCSKNEVFTDRTNLAPQFTTTTGQRELLLLSARIRCATKQTMLVPHLQNYKITLPLVNAGCCFRVLKSGAQRSKPFYHHNLAPRLRRGEFLFWGVKIRCATKQTKLAPQFSTTTASTWVPVLGC